MRFGICAALVALAVCGAEAAPKKSKKSARSLDYARTWDDALVEARALNLPLVIHRHGFY